MELSTPEINSIHSNRTRLSQRICRRTLLDDRMETSDTPKPTAAAAAPAPIATSVSQPPTSQLPSPPHSQTSHPADVNTKMSLDAADSMTPPFSPSSQTPVLQKEQEEFEGTVDVNNDIPSEKDLAKVEDLLVLDAQGQSRPFKELYKAPHVASKQLIIFIRHFFCGVSPPSQTCTPPPPPVAVLICSLQNCQEYLRTLASSIKPDDLLSLPTPTFITVIGCGRPELIPMYTETTGCPFPIYADPSRKLYDHLGMTRTFNLGAKPEYMQTNVLINSVQSIFQGLSTGKKALKGGDFKQVGGEFLFENGECELSLFLQYESVRQMLTRKSENRYLGASHENYTRPRRSIGYTQVDWIRWIEAPAKEKMESRRQERKRQGRRGQKEGDELGEAEE